MCDSADRDCRVLMVAGVCVGDAVGEERHSWYEKPHCKSLTGSPMFIAMACIIARAASVPDHSFCLYLDGIAFTMQMLFFLPFNPSGSDEDVEGSSSVSESSSESESVSESDPDPFTEGTGFLLGFSAVDGDGALGRAVNRLKPRDGITFTLIDGLEDGCDDKYTGILLGDTIANVGATVTI
jgi:hypothetical protein